MDGEFRKNEELSKHPIKICIVGHTNHGKTSTIRTLIEDAHVGTVDEAPDTTTEVEASKVSKKGFTRFFVFDSPGFTNLDARLAEFEIQKERTATLDDLIEFQKGRPSPADTRLYDTLRQIKRSNLIIQVLDSREDPSNESYIDEINFLKGCGVPLIVSLNYIHRGDSKTIKWKKRIRSLGVNNIIEFDAHKRTWEDEHDLFKCIRPLLCDPTHSRLHKDFLDYWTELRKVNAQESSQGAANDIAKTLFKLSHHVTRVDGVTRANKKEKLQTAKSDFQKSVKEISDEGADSVFNRYGFSWDDAKKYHDTAEGEKTAATFSFFDHSKLKWSAAVAAFVTVATIEVLTGVTTLWIPTVLATAAAYFTASAFQVNREGGGTAISVRPSMAMVNLIALTMVSVARILKTRGKANDKMIEVRLDEDIAKENPELIAEVAEISDRKEKDLDDLRRYIIEAIVKN